MITPRIVSTQGVKTPPKVPKRWAVGEEPERGMGGSGAQALHE